MTSQSTDKPSKKSGGLLDQYNLLGAIIDASWATRLDVKVARHVIDRYYPKHGNGRASLRYLERATGSSKSNITTSLRRLTEHGAIIMLRQGQGTRPTEYALNFEFPVSVPADSTTSDDFLSVPVGVTPGGDVDSTTSAPSVPVGRDESYLLVPAYKADVRIDRDICGLATPAVDGLSATTAATPQEGKPTFELLWRTYGKERAGGKKEARTSWNALPPETDLAAVIEAAAAWREAWAKQNNPKAPRYTLARWIADERFEQDVPGGFEPKAKAKAKAKPTKGTMQPMAIVDVREEGSPFANWFVTVKLQASDGQQIERQFHVSDSAKDYGDGPDADIYRELMKAAGDNGLRGAHVGVTETGGKLTFHNIGQPAHAQPTAEPEPWVGDVDRFAPFGTFSATFLDSAVDWNENGQFVTLMLEISDTSGGTEITRQVNHTFDMETMRGRAFLASICRAVGIAAIEDTEVLHGTVLECTITDRGEISYAPLMERAA